MFFPSHSESKARFVNSLKVTDTLKSKKCKNRPIKRHFVFKYSCKTFNIGKVSNVECKNSIGLDNTPVIHKTIYAIYMTYNL